MSPWRVDLVAPPMSGHLHPVLGMARRLARDVDVRVISTPAAMPEVESAGLRGHAMLRDADADVQAVVNPSHTVGSHPLRLHAQFRANLRLLARARHELDALWRDDAPNLVIADFTVPVAGAAAAALGIEWWTSAPSPCAIETPDGPPAYLGGCVPRADLAGRCGHAIGRQVIRWFKRGVHRLHRAELTQLGFPAVYRADGYEAIYSPHRVLALGLGALEFARRHAPAVEHIGPVLFTPPGQTPPPPVSAGRRHVLVSLGTHLAHRRAAVSDAVQRAARCVPDVTFHMSDGDRVSARDEVVGGVRHLGYVSYAEHVHRYDLVVHHGGTGVLYHTLAAGLPAVVVPADYDQFDNAARVEVAGAGVWARSLDDLPRLIARALDDAALRSVCARLRVALAATSAEARVAALVAERVRSSRARCGE